LPVRRPRTGAEPDSALFADDIGQVTVVPGEQGTFRT